MTNLVGDGPIKHGSKVMEFTCEPLPEGQPNPQRRISISIGLAMPYAAGVMA
jgi:hypothetical protein